MEYASYAPGAPAVYIDEPEFSRLWVQPQRYYLLVQESRLPRFERLLGSDWFHVVAESGGKALLVNHPLDVPSPGNATSFRNGSL